MPQTRRRSRDHQLPQRRRSASERFLPRWTPRQDLSGSKPRGGHRRRSGTEIQSPIPVGKAALGAAGDGLTDFFLPLRYSFSKLNPPLLRLLMFGYAPFRRRQRVHSITTPMHAPTNHPTEPSTTTAIGQKHGPPKSLNTNAAKRNNISGSAQPPTRAPFRPPAITGSRYDKGEELGAWYSSKRGCSSSRGIISIYIRQSA